ncbi:DUF4148 domain-containing protein [Paraburkholderia sp. Ac-20340]|uniref:DUF4148 domain-containing protein n=1 Tax=Paraburkholderia sp. Ac-20340 TaxID=2703888 RepID=UPI00198264D3|nr:DUF4148 domain-containing protein [Paraburkholderia sp. Ac-20340]MBN3856205.1 DUF4148 domain-containing protein [Paraburkholderia sp. Ac-20340]
MNLVRSLVAAAVVVAAAVPAVSFAQDHTITRAEVRAELVQLQQAGYQPASDNNQYPANLQAALSRIAANQQGANAAYGGSANGSSESAAPLARVSHVGHPAADPQDVPGLEPIYAHS